MAMAEEVVIDQTLEKEEWLKRRRGEKGWSIGASEAATAAAVGGYCTPYHLLEYIQTLEQSHPWMGNENTKRGNRMEPILADLYAAITGYDVRQGNLWIPNPEYNPNFQADDRYRFAASLDGQVAVDSVSKPEWSLEIKCISYPMYRIPADYMAQMQQQLAITGYPYSDFFAAWCDETDETNIKGIFYKRVYFSKSYWNWIYPRLRAFSLVLSGHAPLTDEFKHIRREDLCNAPKVRVEDGFYLLYGDITNYKLPTVWKQTKINEQNV